MAYRVDRPLEYADRFGRQQADQAIKKSAIRALVELITNSDDSYERLEERGKSASGTIDIDILRKRESSEIWVADYAEGMDSSNLDKGLGTYGEESSEFEKGARVRGYFGRGLKDSILGLGHGNVTSIKDGKLYTASLTIEASKSRYREENPRLASPKDRENLGIPTGNGTVVRITVSRNEVRIPQIATIRLQLPLYYSLRDILTNASRKLFLREIDGRGNVRNEWQLSYKPPKGLQIKVDTQGFFQYEDKTIPFQFVLLRSELPLDTPSEGGSFAQGGLLIKGKHAIYDNTLFKFDGEEAARHFLGRVICPALDDVLKVDSSLIRATRDGLDSDHPFSKLLKGEVERLLEPYVREEQRASREKERKALSAKLQRKLKDAIQKLNDIAKLELEPQPGPGPRPPSDPQAPETGFGFVPPYYHVVSGKDATLLLRCLSSLLPPGTTVAVQSDNQEVTIVTPRVTLEERQGFPWLLETRIKVEGGQVNNLATIIAESDGLRAEALVEVVAGRGRDGDGPPPPPRGGLFNDITFDDSLAPPQRVRYDRATGNIVVYTNASSVKPYADPTNPEDLNKTPHGQILLAELVLEAACFEITRRNVGTGKITLPSGTEADALENEYRKFRQNYGGTIHEVLVDAEFRQHA
ncbi:MAG: ATP-binding protein [Chloroflexi bacterium]|nr:ATP-binding protein [Chloroflexota bacterium]